MPLLHKLARTNLPWAVEPLPEPEKLFRPAVEKGLKSFIEGIERDVKGNESLAKALQR